MTIDERIEINISNAGSRSLVEVADAIDGWDVDDARDRWEHERNWQCSVCKETYGIREDTFDPAPTCNACAHDIAAMFPTIVRELVKSRNAAGARGAPDPNRSSTKRDIAVMIRISGDTGIADATVIDAINRLLDMPRWKLESELGLDEIFEDIVGGVHYRDAILNKLERMFPSAVSWKLHVDEKGSR